MKLRVEYVIVGVGIALLFAAAIFFGRRPEGLGKDPEDAKKGSSHYSTPSGGKAYFRLLQKLGFPVRRHERKIALLPKDTRMLVMLSPRQGLSPEEADALVAWIERGGTLLWSDDDAAFLSRFGLASVSGAGGVGAVGRVDGAEYRLSSAKPRRFRGKGTVLAGDVDGAILAEVPRGAGRFLALADPTLAENRGIGKAENAAFLVHLASRGSKGGAVSFEEYHHGFRGGEDAMATILDTPLSKSILFLGLAAVCGVFAGGRRLGPPIDLHEERRRRPAEFVEAFANLCRKMNARPQALAMVLGEFRLYLQRRCGTAEAAAADRFAARLGVKAGRLAAALARAQKLASDRQAPGEVVVHCARELEAIRSALEKGR